MNWRHWQKVEAGEVNTTLRTLNRIAMALDVDPVDLLAVPPGRSGSPPRGDRRATRG